MNYISQLNAYWNWVKLNPLPSRAGYLYFAILDCANTAGWKREFNAPNSTLQAMAGLDKNGLSRYRNVLIQQGLIEYRQGNRGNTGIYRIVPLYGNQIDTQSDTKVNTQTEPKLIPKVRTYIDKDKEKDIPPISPQGEGKQVDDPQFDSFWKLYPKKKAKEDARKAWNKLKPDGELYTAIMRSLSLQKKSPEWIKDNGQYAPYPATWLRGRRWEDEEPAAAAPKPEPAPLYEKVKPEIWRKRAAP